MWKGEMGKWGKGYKTIITFSLFPLMVSSRPFFVIPNQYFSKDHRPGSCRAIFYSICNECRREKNRRV